MIPKSEIIKLIVKKILGRNLRRGWGFVITKAELLNEFNHKYFRGGSLIRNSVRSRVDDDYDDINFVIACTAFPPLGERSEKLFS